MKFFFAAAIKGGRAYQPEFKVIVDTLARFGAVHAPHTAEAELSEYGETGLPDSEILMRELSALKGCDLVVAEVSTPSLGVGYLIACAVAYEKRVIALYRGSDTLKLSSIIKGDTNINVRTYQSETELTSILESLAQG